MTERSRARRFAFRRSGRAPLPSNPVHRSLTLEEAERAVYVDFESTMTDPPVLIGYQVGDVLHQVVVDSRLDEAASHSGLRTASLNEGLRLVLDLCLSEERLLVAYSQHEREAIHEHLGVDVSDVYRDARMIAVRWKSRTGLKLPTDDHELKTFLIAIGYPRRAYLGTHLSAKWVREVIEMVGRKGSFASLTPTKKRAWTKLLEHNQVDCDGMRQLVLLAVTGLRK